MTGGEADRQRSAIGRIAAWGLCVIGVALVTLLAGVGVAVVLSGRGDNDQWRRLSDVGQTFGVLSSVISGLALITVVATARVQFRDMRRNRRELRRQREFLARSQSELHRTAELSHLDLLMKILKMSIDDVALAEVWPEFEAGLSEERNRQYLYANIIYQFNLASMRMNGYSEEQVFENMRYLFRSVLMRDYWSAAVDARKALRPGTVEYDFSRRMDQLCREYEQVAANAKRTRIHSAPADPPAPIPPREDAPEEETEAA